MPEPGTQHIWPPNSLSLSRYRAGCLALKPTETNLYFRTSDGRSN